MAIAIGLDDCADRDLRADMLLHDAEIFAQRGERDFRPGAAVKRERAAIGQSYTFHARSIHYGDYSDHSAGAG